MPRNTLNLDGPMADFPDVFPGDFCVVVYDRELELFSVMLDDADQSSYALVGEPPAVAETLAKRVGRFTADAAVDAARSFGASQIVFSDARVIPLGKEMEKTPDQMLAEKLHDAEHKHTNWCSLPTAAG